MDTATVLRNGAIGAASGLAAAFAMSQFQSAWSAVQKKLQPRQDNDGEEEPSTVKAADRLSQATTGEPVPGPDREAAGQAVHYGFGALLGGLYGVAATASPVIRAGFGAPFGAAAWAVADETMVPAAGLSKPSTRTPLSTHAYGLISHLLFGAALEGSRRAFESGLSALGGEAKRQAH